MTILFLTLSKSILNLDFDSQRGVYPDLLREFEKNGHRVYVVAPTERRNRQGTRLIKAGTMHLLQVKTGNIRNTNPIEKGISTVLLEGQFISAIKNHLNAVKFDLVLFSTPPITFERVVRFIKKRDQARSYLLLKDIFPQNAVDLGFFGKYNPLFWYFRRKEKKLYQISDSIGCMSPANVAYIQKHNPLLKDKPVEVCPNSIEPLKEFITEDQKKAVRQKYGLPENSMLFIYGGNLGKPQGLGFLLEVIKQSLAIKDVFYLIIGTGTEYKKLETWFNRVQPANARLLPVVPKKDYDQIIQAADVGMIFLDRRYTIPNFPSRLLSYLECSLPVISATDTVTDIGTIMEENEFGLWCESGDTGRFMANLKTFLADPEKAKAMGKKGRAFLEKNYLVSDAYQTIMRQFENV